MGNLYEYYLNKAIELELISEENIQQEPDENSDKTGVFTNDDLFNKKNEILIKWIKKLNSKFKPYAIFKITVENDDEGNKDVYISLKPKDLEMNRHFYHITPDLKLTEKLYDELTNLANDQVKTQTYN